MDAGNWITIGVAGVAFIGQLVNTWYKDWLERRKTNKGVEQPQYRTEHIGSWLGNRLISVFLSMISMATAAIFLIRELSETDPITRETIFNIALYTGVIFSQLLLMLIYCLLYLTHQKEKIILDLLHRHNESINGIMQVLEKFSFLSSKQTEFIEQISTIASLSLKINQEDSGNKENSIC